MHDIIAALVSIVGGGITLAYVTKLLVDVLQPDSKRNTWKNAMLTVAGMALVVTALLAVQHLSLVRGLPFEAQAVAAAVVVFGVLSGLVTHLFDMPFDEVIAVAPVIGTTTAAIGGVLFFAVGA